MNMEKVELVKPSQKKYVSGVAPNVASKSNYLGYVEFGFIGIHFSIRN